MTVEVTSDDPAPPESENLTAWQLTLTIVPERGASGTVSIANVLQATRYLLEGINLGFRYTVTGGATVRDTLVAFDLNFPFSGGARVPVTGSGLMDVSFAASANAAGTFGLYATPDVGSSEWSDNTEGQSAARAFENLPAGAAVRIGEIRVVPESAGGFDPLRITSFRLTQRGRARISWIAPPGTPGNVEASQDLIRWSRVPNSQSTTDESGHASTEFECAGPSPWFYRVAEETSGEQE